MKTRIISAIVMVVVCVPCLLFGGWLLNILLSAAVLGASYEFLSIRKKKFNVVLYVSMVVFIIAVNTFSKRSVGLILFYLIFLFFLAMVNEEVTLDDISSTLLMSIIMAFAINSVLRIYEINSALMFYILFSSLLCDTFAYFTGYFFGKHKLIERVSPKKTVEGAVGGWAGAALCAFGFAYAFKFFGFSVPFMVFSSITLPVVAQIGDLSFSLIKRNYGAKDFGSIIPGHGGILDRVDSVLFCLIYFMSMVSLLAGVL